MIRTINFALGEAKVRVLSKIRLQTGIVCHVEDIDTGHQDFVGIEYLKMNTQDRSALREHLAQWFMDNTAAIDYIDPESRQMAEDHFENLLIFIETMVDQYNAQR